jgi:prepilin-type N-terminal cleavage/methylation domain-containing protein
MIIMKKSEAGFTLIEVLVSLTILGIVLAGVVAMFTSTSRNNARQEMMTDVTQSVRNVKNLMVDEIRSARSNYYNAANIGFQTDADDRYNTDDNSIHFTRDIDNDDGDQFFEPDGIIQGDSEEVFYWREDESGNVLNADVLTPGILRRRTGSGVAMPVLQNIVNLKFQYYDQGNVLIDPATMGDANVLASISTVEVVIVGQVARPQLMDAQFQNWTQRFRIKIRN